MSSPVAPVAVVNGSPTASATSSVSVPLSKKQQKRQQNNLAAGTTDPHTESKTPVQSSAPATRPISPIALDAVPPRPSLDVVPPRTSLSEPAPARTVNIHDRKFVDRVFSDMRSIAHLNENDRPSVQGTEGGISIDRYVAWTSAPFSRGFQAWKRFSTNDGRAACLVKVKSTIDTMILIVHEWALEKARMKQREIEKREAAESGRPTVMEQMEDKKARCDIDLNLANALDSLESGKLGVEALKKTYGSDQATLSDLEVTLLKITNELTKIRACLPVAEMLS